MHAVEVLQKCLPDVLGKMHTVRVKALLGAVRALLVGRRLILMDLARAWPGAERVRAPLKCLDRLLGNWHLHDARISIYASMARWLIRHDRPVIVIDWSELRADNRWHLLRAGIPVGGRTLTILEGVYPKSLQGSPRSERPFLQQLKTLLPEHVKPIIVTDAGFKAPWFKALDKLGWNYVGRLRHRTRIKLNDTHRWFDNRALFLQANHQPCRFNRVTMVQYDPWVSNLVLYRHPKQGRYCLTRQGSVSYSRRSTQAARREREPWLLVTSSGLDDLNAKQIINLYRRRMQIEESFRDLKCDRFGCAFNYSLTRDPQRLMILLLIHALATFVAWLMAMSLAIDANVTLGGVISKRSRRHYSLLRLGWEALRRYQPPNFHSILTHVFNHPPTQLLQQLALPS